MRQKFGNNLARLRLGHRLTQEKMAERTGLSTRYWQSLEAGEYFPPLATLVRIKEAFNCSWENMFKGCG